MCAYEHKNLLLTDMEKIQSFQTTCGICNGSCGITVNLKNNVVHSVQGQKEHPITEGYICPKGKAIPELVNSPERIKFPLKKNQSGEFERVSWDEAFDYIVEKLKYVKEKYGTEALAIHNGQPGVRKQFPSYIERFCSLFGTPNISSSGSHCHKSKDMANRITFGVLPTPDYENSNCIVLWGYNPSNSCPPIANIINRARKKDAKLIVIDSQKTPIANNGEIYLQIRPGSDGALALAMLNVIIKEELYDKEFVEKWTIGFDKLIKLTAEYTPEKVEKITWIPADKIIEVSRLYAKSQTAVITPGISIELQDNGFQAIRAMAILQAITANIDVAGGSVFCRPAELASLKVDEIEPSTRKAIGQTRFPLFNKLYKQAQANVYTDSILQNNPYAIKSMIIIGSNPILTWPNTNKVRNALEKLEFLVVMDHFMTETAKLADLIIPAATFLERNELWDGASMFAMNRIGLSPKIFDSECISEWMFIKELAHRMGYKEYFPWETEEDAINFRLKPLGITIEELKDKPNGHVYCQHTERKYEKKGFKTPSGKIELYSETLEKHGLDPLPVYKEPHESFYSTPELAIEYPFIVTTCTRTIGYFHSRYRNIPSLNKIFPEPVVYLNEKKAKDLSIEDGELVIFESKRGSFEVKVRITEKINELTLFIEHGWDNANANLLTDNEYLDPVTGFPACSGFLGRITKK